MARPVFCQMATSKEDYPSNGLNAHAGRLKGLKRETNSTKLINLFERINSLSVEFGTVLL
jgi:hypothetical protein